MEHVGRIRVLAPLAAILVVGAVGFTRPAMLHAGDPAWDPPPCPPGKDAGGGTRTAAWYSLDPQLDAQGSLVAQQLSLGNLAGTILRRLDLSPESFASGPVGGRVLVGDDDGWRSRLRIVDVTTGCAMEIGREASVVRGAIASPDGRIAWEHRVNRATRADEGVWQRTLRGGAARRVLPGLPVDDRFGPTYATELALTGDGRLAVASCGEVRCRVRVLDPGTGRVDRVDGTGPLLGVAGDRLIAYGACPGLPCRIDAVDLRSGRRATMVEDAGLAAMDGEGRGLAYETPAGALAILDLETLRATVITVGDARPVRGGSGVTSGADAPPGSLLLAPAGHLADPAAARRLDVATGKVAPLAEVWP